MKLPGTTIELTPQEDFDLDEATGRGAPLTVKGTARTKQLVYNVSGRTIDFQEPDYNLTDVAAAIDTESYFRLAVDRFVNEIWKNGWSFIGKDPNAVSYVKRRFHQVSMVTKTPTDDLFEDIARQLVMYSNVFLEKKRSDNSSGGRRWTRFDGKELIPIAGLFALDSTSMEIARQDNGTPVRYRQTIPGAARPYPEWPADDMCHMHFARQRGLAFGTPFVIPVLDDIRALRYMEQNIEILVFQHAVPLYFYQVGTTDAPLKEGELALLESRLNEMPKHGVLMGSERHAVTVIGAEGEAVKADAYLEHFKTRVLSGLRLGAVVVGEGNTANRSTAGTINAIVQDVAQSFQKRIKIFINLVINELLAEGGFEWDAGQFDHLVELFIPEIDIEKKMAMDNHNLNLWQGSAITSSEMRLRLGREPYTADEWADTHWSLIDQPKALIQALDELWVRQGINKASTAGASSTPSKGVTKNKAQPANQHGTRSAPKTNKDFSDKIGEEVSGEHISLLFNLGYPQFYAGLRLIMNDLKSDISMRYDLERSKKMIDPTISLAEGQMVETANSFVSNAFTMAAASAGYAGIPENLGMKMLLDSSVGDVSRFIEDVKTEVHKSLRDNDTDKLDLLTSIEAMEYRLDFMARTLVMNAYNQGVAKAAMFFQDTELSIQNDSNENDGCNGARSVDLSDPSAIDQLPPFHPNCTCNVRRKSTP